MGKLINYDGNKKRAKGRSASLLLLIFCLLFLAGCKNSASLSAGKKSEKGYTAPEIMVIAMTEKNRYEEICTDQIWGVAVDDGGDDFSSYLTGQIRNFMDELKIMNLLAQDKGLSLSPEERSRMSSAATKYYGALTAEDIAYMGVTEDDVRTVFEDYCMAEKLVEELTKSINLEVSDSEAKVIALKQIQTADRQTAESFSTAASQESADFDKCAGDAGLTVTSRKLGRKEEAQEYEDVAFALSAGQVSSVIESGGSYYVVQCVNDYDEEATAARKQVIFEERKRKAFKEIYDGFAGDLSLSYPGDLWEKLDLSAGQYAKDADFFEIYKEYSGE